MCAQALLTYTNKSKYTYLFYIFFKTIRDYAEALSEIIKYSSTFYVQTYVSLYKYVCMYQYLPISSITVCQENVLTDSLLTSY